ncbi:MAG TPA: hypothetical protein VFZ24_05105 [Longimicrobiales bacterium]
MARGGVDSLPDPPGAPRTRRHVSLFGFQWVGVAVLAAFPVLALLGVFGERWATVESTGGPLHVNVRYPTVFRYKMLNAIDLDVRNTGTAVIDTITVALDTVYASRFSTITAVPPFSGPYEVELPAVQPRETRRVRIEIQAERYWVHAGTLTVATRTDTVRVPLRTTIYP